MVVKNVQNLVTVEDATEMLASAMTKGDITELLKLLIPSGVILLLAFGAYKNKFSASIKCFGCELNLIPQ